MFKLKRRSGRRTAQDLFDLFSAIAENWRRRAEAESGDDASVCCYVRAAGFDTPEKVAAMRAHYEHWLAHVPGLEGSIGCDLGCWRGFSTATQAALGCALVYGVDPIESSIVHAEQWRTQFGVDNIRFRAMRAGIVPLSNDSVDWVIINQVFCNALPESFSNSLREAHRILKEGGQLLFSDANNPYCPAALERLRDNFRQNEIGDGTLAQPNGPNYRARLSMIQRHRPELAEEEARRLARETCYLYGDQIKHAVDAYLASGQAPASAFVPGSLRPTCVPGTGASNGNLTDPYALCAELRSIGFETPQISCSPRFSVLDNEALWEQLQVSQGFFVFAKKAKQERGGG